MFTRSIRPTFLGFSTLALAAASGCAAETGASPEAPRGGDATESVGMTAKERLARFGLAEVRAADHEDPATRHATRSGSRSSPRACRSAPR